MRGRTNRNIVPLRGKPEQSARRADLLGAMVRSPAFIPVSLIGIGLAGLTAMLAFSPWPPDLTLRHWLAAPNCAAARMAGLAPARRGQPGYFSDHDADHDGIACEPRLRR
jgi:hypothetical protein